MELITASVNQIKGTAKNTRDRLVKMAQSKTAGLGIVFVDAMIENQDIVENVLVKIPAAGDVYLKFCPEHQFAVPANPMCNSLNIIAVASHYRRSLPFEKGKKVYRNFYTDKNFLGQRALADVKIKIKTDFARGGERSIILDYVNIRAIEDSQPSNNIVIGTTHGQIPIFGTDKFILLEKINVKVLAVA
jgi:hypothetical protein